jgi:hypothetical protein
VSLYNLRSGFGAKEIREILISVLVVLLLKYVIRKIYFNNDKTTTFRRDKSFYHEFFLVLLLQYGPIVVFESGLGVGEVEA